MVVASPASGAGRHRRQAALELVRGLREAAAVVVSARAIHLTHALLDVRGEDAHHFPDERLVAIEALDQLGGIERWRPGGIGGLARFRRDASSEGHRGAMQRRH